MIAVLVISLSTAAADWSVLAAQLQGVSHIHCAFVQEKKSALFKTALKSTGDIEVRAPQAGEGPALRLAMKTPEVSVLDIKGGHAEMTANGKTEQLPIDRVPQVQSFLSAFSDLFLGRTEALQKAFTLQSATSKGGALTALLAPHDTSVFSAAEVTFAGGVANKVVLHEAQGDTTTIVLEHCEKK